MYLLTVAVITMCAGLVYGQSSQCQKPDGKSDECISLLECKPLREQLDKPNKTDQDLFLLSKSLTKLHCGSIRVPFVPKVCCPDPNTGQRINSPPPCNTSDGKIGQCINLFSCPHLSNLLQPPVPQEVISFVQSYRCVGPEEHSVCCGPAPTTPQTTTPPTTRTPPEFRNCSALMTAFPPDRNSECCGVSVAVVRKRVGNTVGIDEYPWVVAIEYISKRNQKLSLRCGGALISGKYVLTAAHCITGEILQIAVPIAVRLGEYDISHEGKDCILAPQGGAYCTEGEINIGIDKTIPHPDYKSRQLLTLGYRHDIGLIRMIDTAPYTAFIRPICLPSKDLTQPENTPPPFSMYVVGWGLQGQGTQSDVKQDRNILFVSLEKCQSIHNTSDRSMLWKGQLCAIVIEATGRCRGDSGGSLVYENQEKFELIGIDSFGGGCEEGDPGLYTNFNEFLDWLNSDAPEIYTNVYEYLDWIKSVIVA